MKLALSLLALAATTHAFRDQTQKKGKNLKSKNHRHLEVCTGDEVLVVNHNAAEVDANTGAEVPVEVVAYPGDNWKKSLGLFSITLTTAPFVPEGQTSITTYGWCIDYDRDIDTGHYEMDVFTAYDPDIHSDAVDFKEYFPNLAFLINNVNVGDKWPTRGNKGDSDYCKGVTLRWMELQRAVWYIIDDNQAGPDEWFEGTGLSDCTAQQIAEYALANGNDYVMDCTDPDEQVPLVMIVDLDDETITNQVIISETNVHTVDGLCTCHDPAEPTASPTESPTESPTKPYLAPPKEPEDSDESPDEKQIDGEGGKGSSSGDPHFKTWTGDKFDYHGECDLVLVDNPSFNNGQGLRVHIRTTRVKYFSYIEAIAVQIGDDVLEFTNDVDNFLINGAKVEANQKHHKTTFGGFIVRRDSKAVSIRLIEHESRQAYLDGTIAKIDLHTRKNGFPAVIVDGAKTDVFKGSMGLLGEWGTGRKLARDGVTEMEATVEDATAFALEWQVRDDEPMLFSQARFPQFPTQCTPPEPWTNRLGSDRARAEAEEACAHWKEDMDDCIFDVMATRDIMVAQEGHIVHIE